MQLKAHRNPLKVGLLDADCLRAGTLKQEQSNKNALFIKIRSLLGSSFALTLCTLTILRTQAQPCNIHIVKVHPRSLAFSHAQATPTATAL